ncbi:phosphopyruvate hydratase [Gloeocapsa sp. PCC 73106]|uniref:phosphopyruvate hydratase n=1 Tax=Gloeocapsa sp. PCC 73106 TaxID=102232 RepID=UPI0002ACB5DB|nr:phosphopyruvate hydratase [Gloeocapsa sp. PCC 73106]ELR97058.1 phosphopyruvate hydratase [Gloeocapsa sp. PCC 73106]
MKIQSIHAREILDSRGYPTVEVDVVLEDGSKGRSAVPSGASMGTLEALELRDGDGERYSGRGVLKAVANVNKTISPALIGTDGEDQEAIDNKMIEMDGTEYKQNLGANAILGVSMSVARAAASSKKISLYQYLGGADANLLPAPCFNVINGGAHADNNVDFQEFMIVPVGASTYSSALEWGAEVFHSLKSVLQQKGYSTGVGDEGGFAPNLASNVEAVEVILESIEKVGLKAGSEVCIALDPALTELHQPDGSYLFYKSDQSVKSTEEIIQLWESWVNQFPIISIEDGLGEKDWTGWQLLTKRLGDRIQIVGDDIFVTNPKIIRQAIAEGVGNSSLIKVNQIGTVTETLKAIKESKDGGYTCMISHRSGETTDDFIADLVVATGSGQIKTGAPCRGERLAKYNQLLRIEEELGSKARYAGIAAFKLK